MSSLSLSIFFFFNDTATTEIYTLSLHDALPICDPPVEFPHDDDLQRAASLHDARRNANRADRREAADHRSEEHTSELQSQSNLVCRLLLEKKKKKNATTPILDSIHASKHPCSQS